jgi:hypothetical protein
MSFTVQNDEAVELIDPIETPTSVKGRIGVYVKLSA